ncbi:hypothetical protein [Streptomyces lasiicapitis]|uniref:DUF4398 domain-containing protein n=1 Tax=Streptomyces lasiicapitis TaxID=1923961 RepID=A0ABQ2MY20_9ACTN|nr:hypothetical protein [Streptomyces lasiicapitis]GGO60092.1 hypothetical protein GCM10012286_83190 [Streptomyces lasiicapitis]
MANSTDHRTNTTAADTVSDLHAKAAADYAAGQDPVRQAAARDQLADARSLRADSIEHGIS